MKRCLLTHSLLSAWLYAIKENPNENAASERDPAAAFMQTLLRQPTATTDAMQKGIDFEDLVTDILAGKNRSDHSWYGAAAKIASVIGGGVLQYRARKEILVNGLPILLYGRLDALRAGGIYDIKFSSGYERGRYFDSTQHPVYLELVPEAEHFTYLVSNGSEVWQERYTREDTPSIFPILSDFLSWLDAYGLLRVYAEKWKAE